MALNPYSDHLLHTLVTDIADLPFASAPAGCFSRCPLTVCLLYDKFLPVMADRQINILSVTKNPHGEKTTAEIWNNIWTASPKFIADFPPALAYNQETTVTSESASVQCPFLRHLLCLCVYLVIYCHVCKITHLPSTKQTNPPPEIAGDPQTSAGEIRQPHKMMMHF